MGAYILAFGLGAAVAAVAAWWMTLRWARRLHAHERDLVRRTRRAERMAELGGLTGHLAHEIRNPLSIIKINLKLLGEDIQRMVKEAGGDPTSPAATPGQGEEIRRRWGRWLKKIETVSGEGDRLGRTLNEFLSYAGKIEMHPGRHDVNELLDELVDFYTPQASAKGIQMRLSLAGRPGWCRVDPDLFKQAILNLLINATQAIEDGKFQETNPKKQINSKEENSNYKTRETEKFRGEGTRGVEPHPTEHGELMVQCKVGAGEVLITVTDTGPGIAAAEQEKIFDAYYTTKASGTGLGLPTCRRIVEEQGGRIELHSEVGKGTSFVIMLPLVE